MLKASSMAVRPTIRSHGSRYEETRLISSAESPPARAAEMFEQVLKRKEGISDVGFRPVQKHAPIRRSNDISWVQIKMT